MKQRSIIVPKDKAAEEALDFGEAIDSQLIKLTLSNKEFYELYKTGIFDLINKIAKVNIDDFEDERIIAKIDLTKIIDSLSNNQLFYSEVTKPLVLQIKQMFEEALKIGTGVYFFF